MILVTRLNGAPFAVNPDLLERVEETPDTVLTLIDGTKYLVTESVHQVVDLVRDYRASVVAAARARTSEDAGHDGPPSSEHRTRSGHARPDAPHLHLAPAATEED